MSSNLILNVDSYKSSHFLQFPKNTTAMYSYLESRGGRYGHTLFFGLQYLLKEYLTKPVTVEMVEEAKEFFEAHGEPFPYEGWMYVAKELKGKIPLHIRAVPEGTIVPVKNVLMDVESTDPKVFWIATWFETLLMRVWYPTTVATQSWHIRQLISAYLKETSDDPAAEIGFKLHDFGSRGVSSGESAALGGAAHLVSFLGSDTVEGVLMANRVYNEKMAGFSIPAAEHSTITSWGKENEAAAYENMLDQFAKPGKIVAVVTDSYDIWNAIEHIWGEKLKSKIVNSGATVVIRPDSGNPPEVVLKTLELLEEKFGVSYNSKSYKVLNNVRVIQGDGVNEDSIRLILEVIKQKGYSASNVAFGMGGALLQKVDRDTQKFAYKCSEVTVDGQHRDVFKDPITDPGKASKKGRLDLVWRGGKFSTVPQTVGSSLKSVFRNGQLLVDQNLSDIRTKANSYR